eukprot:4755880-Amphidinium_carterae.1
MQADPTRNGNHKLKQVRPQQLYACRPTVTLKRNTGSTSQALRTVVSLLVNFTTHTLRCPPCLHSFALPSHGTSWGWSPLSRRERDAGATF